MFFLRISLRSFSIFNPLSFSEYFYLPLSYFFKISLSIFLSPSLLAHSICSYTGKHQKCEKTF